MNFADPKNDLAFKKIFGDENKKFILISFLNAVLGFEGNKKIKTITLADSYQVPKIPELKETILDVKAVNELDEHFIVEMQKNNLGDFAKRSLYYTSKAYVEQLDKNKNYSILKKVYFIGILDFKMLAGDNYISRHLILNQETQQQDIKDFEFAFLELPKFTKQLNELASILDKWIYFLQNASSLELIPKEYADIEEFKEAFDTANQQTWNKQELKIYDYMGLKAYDEINALKTAENKGIEQGVKQGMEQGVKQGMEQGVKKVAINLLDILDDKTISAKTGLSMEQVKSLRK